jgi:hypothetical protein
MRYLLTILIFSTLACSTANKQASVEERAKQYMKDSIVPKFNDPASYQFISLKIDTFTGEDYLKNLNRYYIDADTSVLPSGTYEEKKQEIARLSSIQGYSDSILHLNIEVEYRGKNKMGGLVIDKSDLRYLPQEDRIIAVQ